MVLNVEIVFVAVDLQRGVSAINPFYPNTLLSKLPNTLQ